MMSIRFRANPRNKNKLNEYSRCTYYKGMAATMGFSDIAELTHKNGRCLSEFREES